MRNEWLICCLAGLAACSPAAEDTSGNDSRAAASASAPVDVPAGAYTLDKGHASLLFRVDHLGFSNYTARFKDFDAQLHFDPAKLDASSVTVTVDPQSIETDYPFPEQVDFNGLIRGEQFLDADRYPEMVFRSISVEPTGGNSMRIHGELDMHGVTRPVVLDTKFNGGYAGHPMDPNARIGFSARGSLKRSEFGMTYGIPEPGSKMGVGDEVEVIVEAEFTGPPLAAAAD